jgi:hypothetical protein
MADDATRDELREELRSLDERIAALRTELEGLIGEQDPGDQEDAGAGLTTLEEERALLEALERRRHEVAAELGDA